MSTTAIADNKVVRSYEVAAIKADASGSLPTQIEVLKVGAWRTPYHGDFMVTPEDLYEYVDHFNAGVGLPDNGSAGAPIDFGHDSGEKAAGWMTALTTDGMTLFATVKWSKAGKEALLGDEFKFFSPEFYPKSRGGWVDPEDNEHVETNVLVGGGLTNIPLFKSLSCLKASADGKQTVKNIEYINANELEETIHMRTLDELRKLEASAITNDEMVGVILASRSDLSEDECKKFGLEFTGKKPDEAPTPTPITASAIKGDEGDVVVKASEVKEIFDRVKSLEEAKVSADQTAAEEYVDKFIATGAVVADQKPKWVALVMADAENKKLLESLQPNPAVAASTIGTGQSAEVTSITDAITKLDEKTAEIKASNTGMSTIEAYKMAQDQNPDLVALLNKDRVQE